MPDTHAIATRPKSVLLDMSDRFGMEAAAFEATLRATVFPANGTREDFAAFLLVARDYQLNPVTREIYAFPKKGGGVQPIVGVDGWAHIINAKPEFDGMEFDDQFDDKGGIVAITCRMFRKDRTHPTAVTEYLAECKRDTEPWIRWPARMLRHKTMIQCARYAFGISGIQEPDEYERGEEVAPPRPQRPPANRQITAPAAPEEDYEIVGPDGVIHQPRGPLAIELFRDLMNEAARLSAKSLEGFWESNGLFLTQLRERGYTEQADHLGEEYGKLLDAAAKPKDQKPPEQKPAEPTQQEAPQQAQNAAPAAKPKEVEDLPPFLDRRKNKKPADAPVAQVPTKTPTSPLIKNGGGSWTAFLPWFADQLREIAEADIPSFLGQYKAEYDYLGAHREGDREAIDAIIDGRRK